MGDSRVWLLPTPSLWVPKGPLVNGTKPANVTYIRGSEEDTCNVVIL